MGGLDRVPVKAIAALAGAVLLLIIAFTAPFSGADEGHVGASGQDAQAPAVDSTLVGDGAALAPSRSGVTSPPEPQPSVSIPQPAPGTQPVQTVVVSVDGGCETADGTVRTFLDTAKQVGGRFTFFMSGLCLLPDAQRMMYHPPGKLPGQSDIGFATADLVDDRIRVFTDMWREGHEIGTHFLGHFCGAGGVDSWTAEQWRDEIGQARTFLDTWPGNNPQITDQTSMLPFDSSVIVGDRTPCLEGQRPAMFEAFAAEGFRYDASDPGVLQWPRKVADGALWQFPLPALKLTGTDKWVLSMDYNLLVNQTGGETEVAPDECARVEEQTYQTYMDALEGVYNGNRAPLFLGSHLNSWACDAYIKALERFVVDAHARHPDVMFVSNRDLADWLDAMDPATLKGLQKLPEQKY